MKNAIQKLQEKSGILMIYLLLFLYFVGKTDFYQQYVGRYPDENIHVAYIAYLAAENELIPEFKNIYSSLSVSERKKDQLTSVFTLKDTHSNYLGHPPLYYHLMRLSGGVTIRDGQIYIHLERLRDASQLIAYLGILLAFYIGFTRLKKPISHLIYGTVTVTVPMLAYNTGVNNDVMVFLGVTIVMLAFLRFEEGKRNALSYWLMAAGVFVSMLSKLTGGLIVAVAIMVYTLLTIKRDKDLSFLLNKRFLVTIPVYLLILGYFGLIYYRYGTVQPSFDIINPEGYRQSSFYVPESERVIMKFGKYADKYWEEFFGTWTGIASHVSLYKPGTLYSPYRIALISIMFIPLLAFWSRRKKVPHKWACLSLYIGTLFAAGYQFYHAYTGYLSNGYPGGYQSRYYLCALPVIAFLVAGVWEDRTDFHLEAVQEKHKTALSLLGSACAILFCALLIYEDFGYFILHFNNYLSPLL